MRSFYWDIFLMFLTYGILTYLSIYLMRRQKRKKGGDDTGGWKQPEKPIIPDLPDGVIWYDDLPKEELVS